MKFQASTNMLRALALLPLMAASTMGTAHAANRVGWVWANCPTCTSAYTPESAYSYNSAGGAITITPTGTGTYEVSFKKLADGSPDNVEVTAYGSSGYCVAGTWSPTGTTLNASVACYNASGALANSYFTLLYQSRSAGFGSNVKGIGYVWAVCSTSCTAPSDYSYNSTGGTNTIVRNSTGSYTVTLPGLDSEHSDVQVTAYGSNSLCKPQFWTGPASSTSVDVLCFNSSGAAVDTDFDLAYAVDEPFGLANATSGTTGGAWAWANDDTKAVTYTPSKQFQYNGFQSGTLSAIKTSTGHYTVTVPGTLSYDTSHVLVTGYGDSTSYCNVAEWGSSSVYVTCYAPGGAAVNSDFDVTFQTAN